jgi:hypothetical protein
VDDVVIVLSRQHALLLWLMREIRAQPRLVGGGPTGEDLRNRQELMDELRRCFVLHERSTQRYLWPVLRRAWPDGTAIAGAARLRRRRAEERLIKYRWLSERDARVERVMDQVMAGIEEHVSMETHLLGRVRRSLPEEVLDDLGAKLAKRQFLSPTRPHPDIPSRWWAAAVVNPVVGLVDRVVEAFSFGPSGA